MNTNSESICQKCGEKFENSIHSTGNRDLSVRRASHIFQRGEDTPLGLGIEDGQIVIRLGVRTNVWAFEHSNDNNPFDDAKRDFVQKYRVIDPEEFAQDIICAMQEEAEDGSSPLSDFFDRMDEAAVNDGSIGVEKDASGTSAYEKDGG